MCVGHDVGFSCARSTDNLTTPILHDSEFCSDSDGYFGGVTRAQAWMDFCGLSFFFISSGLTHRAQYHSLHALERRNASWRETARQLERFGRQHRIEPHATRIITFRWAINCRVCVCE
jgi:hypothetical protein